MNTQPKPQVTEEEVKTPASRATKMVRAISEMAMRVDYSKPEDITESYVALKSIESAVRAAVERMKEEFKPGLEQGESIHNDTHRIVLEYAEKSVLDEKAYFAAYPKDLARSQKYRTTKIDSRVSVKKI